MNPLQLQINDLKQEVMQLKSLVAQQNFGQAFEETVRDIIFPDQDTLTTRTTSANVTGGGGGTVTVPKTPDIYIRGYFKGRIGNIPFFYLT